MIATSELRRMAEAKLSDASALFDEAKYDNALYICGYAIELALKARICETLGWNEFPSDTKDFQGLQSFQTHDLNRLLHLSGRESRVKQDIPVEWETVSPLEVRVEVSACPERQPEPMQGNAECGCHSQGGAMRIGLLKRWLKGLPEIQDAIAAERGEFSLFALIERNTGTRA